MNRNDSKQDVGWSLPSFTDPMAPHHTYIAGEDEGRLAAAAQQLGLDRGRLPTKQSWTALLFQDNTLTAARMHSVGFIGSDERVDEHGTLHHMVTLRRRRRRPQTQAAGQSLTALFQKPTVIDDGFASSASLKIQEDQDESDQVVDMVEGGSLASAAFGILKGTVGPAILYLPRGFYTSGFGVAIPAMIFATSMYILNSYRLLECWKVETDRNHQVQSRLQEVQALLRRSPVANANKPIYGTAKVEEDALFRPKLLTYPELARRALGPYSLIVEVGIAMFQFGVCLTYLIFVPENLRAAILTLTGTAVSKTLLLWIMILVEIPLAWIRDIRKLTPTNVVASFLIALGLACVLFMAIWEGSRRLEPSGETVFEWNAKSLSPWTDSWLLFIGTSFFMMEGSITLLVPLQEAVYQPDDKAKFADLNKVVSWSIVAFYIVFSATCCIAFGNSIKTAMTASLKGNLGVVVQFFYSTAVILTFPLQAFPAMEVALRVSQQVLPGGSGLSHDENKYFHHIFSTIIIVMLGLIAVCAMDYLGNVVSILGAIFGIPLALVFPPIMHNTLVKTSSRVTKLTNYAVVVVGFFAMAAASFNTVVMWKKGADGG